MNGVSSILRGMGIAPPPDKPKPKPESPFAKRLRQLMAEGVPYLEAVEQAEKEQRNETTGNGQRHTEE